MTEDSADSQVRVQWMLRLALALAAMVSAFDPGHAHVRPAEAQESVAKVPAADLRLVIPPRIFAIVGQPITIHVDNVILTQTPENFALDVSRELNGKQVALGKSEKRLWTFTPEASDLGTHRLHLQISERTNDSSKEVASAPSELIVSSADAGHDRKLSLLIVGDSLTHASVYPNALARLLSKPGNPTWLMLGTHRPGGVAEGVAHEGYGGWTWERFVSHYVPNSEGVEAKLRGSPFLFVNENSEPTLDPSKYFDKHFSGQRPDVIIFLLGINDCFSASPDNLAQTDERIDQVFKSAEKLLGAMRIAAPRADLVVCLTTPPNCRQEAFEANYKDRYPRWGWKRIQHRLVEREIKQFAGREQEQIFVAPTELNVDPVEGYPDNNAVHPNAVGYQQIADTLYAWLKYRLDATAPAR